MGGIFLNQKKEVKQEEEKEEPLQQQSLPKQQQTSMSIPSKFTSISQPQPQSKKQFSIQLSEDDKDMYNLNPGDDDEEEEEYEIDEQISTDTKTKESNNSQTQIEKSLNKQIEFDISTEDEPLSSNRSNGIPIYIEQKEEINSSKKLKEDPNTYCHRIRKKNSLFSLDEVEYYSIHKYKEKESLLSSFGFVDSKIIKKAYIAFFEEGYLYFAKDLVIEKKPNMRKLGNKYPLKDISNIFFEKESNLNMLIHLEFSDPNNIYLYTQKEFYLEILAVDKFITDLKKRLLLLGIECTSNEEQEHNQQEETQKESNKEQMLFEIPLMGE